MRASACAALFLSIVALAGCGDDDEATWEGPPDPSADGAVATEAFVAHAEDVDEPWEGSPAASAAEFLRLDQRQASHTTIDEKQTGEGAGPTTVLVTLEGLFDDSVLAERWTLSFEREDTSYRLTNAAWAQRCQSGRGHQSLMPEPCV
jgi:hypothetical protein